MPLHSDAVDDCPCTLAVPLLVCRPGGYAVLKGIQGGLQLPAAKMLPSFAALREYGNTSCSTTWYVMAYMETCDKVDKGQTIMQVRIHACVLIVPMVLKSDMTAAWHAGGGGSRACQCPSHGLQGDWRYPMQVVLVTRLPHTCTV
jgi:hypothetical protein